MTPESRDAVTTGEKQNSESLIPFEEKIKNLEKADDEGKLTDYMIAGMISGLKNEEQFEALESWLDKIRDEKVRKQSFEYFISRDRSWRPAKRGSRMPAAMPTKLRK